MDAESLERLIGEIGALRESVEELYLVLDHAWRNRQEIYDLLEQRSSEGRGDTYCCDKPDLRWNGDPDHPGVSCESCGFTVAENGSLMAYTDEEIERHRDRQKQLFE